MVVAWRLILATAALALTVRADAQSDPLGAAAPRGCWTTAGGSLSRNGQTRTRPTLTESTRRWSRTFEGTIEGEALVWRDRIVVVERVDRENARIHVLDRRTGAPRGNPLPVETTARLLPSLWRDVIVFRASLETLGAARIGSRGFREFSTTARWDVGFNVQAPLLHRRSVFAVGDKGLYRFEIGTATPTWYRQIDPCGSPAIYGEHVFVPIRHGAVLAIAQFRTVDGNRVAVHESNLPTMALASDVRVQVSRDHFAAHVTLDREKLLRPDGSDIPTAAIWQRMSDRFESSAYLLRSDLCWHDGAWIAHTDIANGHALVLQREKDAVLLAGPSQHEAMTAGDAPVSACGSVCYVGGVAFDAESLDVVWRTAESTTRRMIPATGGVLVTTGAQELVFLGPARPDVASAWKNTGVTGPAAVAVARDGTVLDGELVVDADSVALDDTKLPRDAVVWLATATGQPLALDPDADIDEVVRALERVFRRRRLEPLFRPARLSKDVALFERTVALAEESGLPAKTIKDLHRKLRPMQKGRARYKPIAKKVAPVAAALDTLAADARADTWQAYESLGDDAPFALRYAWIRAFLQRDPGFPPAHDAVRALLPERFAAVTPFDAGRWLEFAKACQEIDLEFVEPGDEADASHGRERRNLARYRRIWGGRGRDDLIGIRSEHLFVAGAADRPATLARCLSFGELVCAKLDEIFASGEAVRADTGPLHLVLFDERADYLALADLGAPESHRRAGGHLGWTAGHYDPRANGGDGLSRMALPSGEDAFRRTLDVFAHELTHHWIDQRCPTFTLAQRRDANFNARGCWIVEGFASMIGGAAFDLDRRTIRIRNPVNQDLALVADMAEGRGAPWPLLFAANKSAQLAFSTDPGSAGAMPLRFHLGARQLTSEMNLFYSQSAAACTYLYLADDGRYRRALVDYLTAHYTARTGKDDGLDVETVFGTKPAELGKRVVEFARDVVNPK